VGHDRLPIVSRSGSRFVATLAVIVLLGSGCVAPGPRPAPTASPIGSTDVAVHPSPSRASEPASSPSAAGSSDGGATPLPDPPPISRPLSAFTIVCADWSADPPPDLLECADAARLALAAIGGERAAAVRRLDIGFGDPCPEPSPCIPAADVRWAVARSAAFETLHVRVARDADGEIRVWPPVEGRPQPPPAFAAPPPAAAEVGPDVPRAIRDSPALPLCGVEDLASPDAFDTPARQCFLDGVAGWVGVELVSRAASTEGEAVTTVYRFTGQGAIERFVRASGIWTAAGCAITPIDTSVVFLLVRPCESIDLER
jgi:hypothetical protein